MFKSCQDIQTNLLRPFLDEGVGSYLAHKQNLKLSVHDITTKFTKQVEYDRPGKRSPEQDYVFVDTDLCFDNLCGSHLQSQRVTLILKMTTARAVETSVTVNKNNSIQDYVYPDDHTQRPQPTNEMTPGFKPFTTKCSALIMSSTFLVPIVSAI